MDSLVSSGTQGRDVLSLEKALLRTLILALSRAFAAFRCTGRCLSLWSSRSSLRTQRPSGFSLRRLAISGEVDWQTTRQNSQEQTESQCCGNPKATMVLRLGGGRKEAFETTFAMVKTPGAIQRQERSKTAVGHGSYNMRCGCSFHWCHVGVFLCPRRSVRCVRANERPGMP